LATGSAAAGLAASLINQQNTNNKTIKAFFAIFSPSFLNKVKVLSLMGRLLPHGLSFFHITPVFGKIQPQKLKQKSPRRK
jgi:hypothetical protein